MIAAEVAGVAGESEVEIAADGGVIGNDDRVGQGACGAGGLDGAAIKDEDVGGLAGSRIISKGDGARVDGQAFGGAAKGVGAIEDQGVVAVFGKGIAAGDDAVENAGVQDGKDPVAAQVERMLEGEGVGAGEGDIAGESEVIGDGAGAVGGGEGGAVTQDEGAQAGGRIVAQEESAGVDFHWAGEGVVAGEQERAVAVFDDAVGTRAGSVDDGAGDGDIAAGHVQGDGALFVGSTQGECGAGKGGLRGVLEG